MRFLEHTVLGRMYMYKRQKSLACGWPSGVSSCDGLNLSSIHLNFSSSFVDDSFGIALDIMEATTGRRSGE